MKNKVIELLKEFYSCYLLEIDDEYEREVTWDFLYCELYFVNINGHIRSRYREGQEFPDYKFLISHFSRIEEFPEYIDEFARDIERAASGRELETIFICDRMPDGDVDSYEWER